MFNALCKSGQRTKYSVLSNKNHTFERINAACVSHFGWRCLLIQFELW